MIQSTSSRRVTIEIDPAALTCNLDSVRRCCPDSKVFSVLKADAYGHGASECARILSAAGSDGFAVVFPDEANMLRQAGIQEPILVLQGPATEADVHLIASLDLWAVIHDISQLALLERALSPLTSKGILKLWIKVDTGMGRMGVSPEQLAQVLPALARHSHLQCMGVLSHFASSDIPGNTHTQSQIDVFEGLETALPPAAMAHNQPPALYRSLANSAGVLAWPQSRLDWVRPGLMLYGSNPLDGRSSGVQLVPAMQVSAPLAALKYRKAGDGIGYGQDYICPENMAVGYAAIGYGDGLPRALSGAQVMIRGQSVPIIGRVSMDSIALDLRGVDAEAGDRVLIWGRDHPVENLARVAATISYELLCSIRGTRVYRTHQTCWQA